MTHPLPRSQGSSTNDVKAYASYDYTNNYGQLFHDEKLTVTIEGKFSNMTSALIINEAALNDLIDQLIVARSKLSIMQSDHMQRIRVVERLIYDHDSALGARNRVAQEIAKAEKALEIAQKMADSPTPPRKSRSDLKNAQTRLSKLTQERAEIEAFIANRLSDLRGFGVNPPSRE